MANENGRAYQGPNVELEGGGGTNYSINDALTTSNYKVKNTTNFWGGNASSPPEVDLFDICELRKESSTREMNVDIAHTKTNLGSFYVNSYSNSLNYRLLDVVTPWQRGISIGYNSEVALIKGTTPREFRFDKSLTNSHASTLTGNIARFLLQRIAGGGKFLIQRENNRFTIDSEVEISGNYAELADTQNTEYYRTNQLGLPTNVTAPYMMLLLVGGAGGGGSSGTDIYHYAAIAGGYNAKDVHGGAGGGGGGVGVFVLDFSSCDGFVISVGSGGSGGSAGSKASGGSSGGSGSQNAGSAGGSTTVYAATSCGGGTFSITKIITCGGGAGGGTSTTTSYGSRAQGGSGGKVTHHDNNTYSYLVGSTSGGSGGFGGASTSDADRNSEATLREDCSWGPGGGSGTGQQQYYMTGNSKIISTLCSTPAQDSVSGKNSNGYYGAGGNGGSSLNKGAKAVIWGPASDGTYGAGGSGGDFGTDGGYAGGKGGDGFFALYY